MVSLNFHCKLHLQALLQIKSRACKCSLLKKFGDALTDWQEPYGMLTFTAAKDQNLKVLQFLYDDETLKFRFLTDLQAVHYPDNKGAELAVVYHIHNLANVFAPGVESVYRYQPT